jgi:group I intron endonuclease
MRYGSIYIATNKHTGEQYVGQTRQPVQKRWAAHWRTAICSTTRKAKFQNALLEFGCDAFEVEEVFVAFDAEALNRAEITVIAELQPSYNASKGGMGLRPFETTEATKRKRSEAAKARWANPDWRAKTITNIKLSTQTPEATARGKKVAAIGITARWANHIKNPLPLPKVKTCKQKRDLAIGRMLAAQSKWKPVYCPELQCSFQSQKAAAEFFGVLRTSVCNAVKQKGKVAGKFTLEMVA